MKRSKVSKSLISLALIAMTSFGYLTGYAGRLFADEENKSPDDLVSRCYEVVLHREPEWDGFEYWHLLVTEDGLTGGLLAANFVFSDEYVNAGTSDEQYIKDLYKLFMDREPDADGIAFWTGKLSEGMSRSDVFSGFVASDEFAGICKECNMNAGYYNPAYSYEALCGVNSFVNSLYINTLERLPDNDGLKHWCEMLLTGNTTAIDCSKFFITSPEFRSQDLSPEWYIVNFYFMFLGRGADEEGLNYWISKLADGMTKDELFGSFVCSEEFAGICAKNGINLGTYVPSGEKDDFSSDFESYKESKIVTLNGQKGEMFTADTACCAEDDKIVIYMEKGVTIPQDSFEIIETIMKSEEEVLGMSYSAKPCEYDSYKSFFYGNPLTFKDVNKDQSKVEIFIAKDKQDGVVENATGERVFVYDYDLTEGGYQALCHELAHVLSLRGNVELGPALDEGIACYAAEQVGMLNGWDVYQTTQYFTDENEDNSFYLQGASALDPMAERNSDHYDYKYGIRFVTFLCETYGKDTIAKMIAEAKKHDAVETDYVRHYSVDELSKIIRSQTSDDVFEKFSKWITDGKWEEHDDKILQYMIDTGFAAQHGMI